MHWHVGRVMLISHLESKKNACDCCKADPIIHFIRNDVTLQPVKGQSYGDRYVVI